MNGQNSNKKYLAFNQEDNYITCPSGFKYYLSYSGRIPFHVLIDDDLNATDIKLYAIIEGLTFAFKSFNKYNYVSNNDLCFLLGLNEKSTAYERAVKKLKDKNLVKREKKTITEKGRTFKGWCWSIESGNFYTLIDDKEQQVPHQEWDTEDKYPTSDGGAVPHQEWDQRSENVKSEESITFSNTKENEFEEVIQKAQECLEKTKENTPSSSSELIPYEYQDTNLPDKTNLKPLTVLQEINSLNLPNEYLDELIKIRKANGGKVTPKAMKAVYQELIKLKDAGLDLNQCLNMYANCGWKGFVADWFINSMAKKPSTHLDHDSIEWGKKMENDPFFQNLDWIK